MKWLDFVGVLLWLLLVIAATVCMLYYGVLVGYMFVALAVAVVLDWDIVAL